MQFAKIALVVCLLVAVALAADSNSKKNKKHHNRNKDHSVKSHHQNKEKTRGHGNVRSHGNNVRSHANVKSHAIVKSHNTHNKHAKRSKQHSNNILKSHLLSGANSLRERSSHHKSKSNRQFGTTTIIPDNCEWVCTNVSTTTPSTTTPEGPPGPTTPTTTTPEGPPGPTTPTEGPPGPTTPTEGPPGPTTPTEGPPGPTTPTEGPPGPTTPTEGPPGPTTPSTTTPETPTGPTAPTSTTLSPPGPTPAPNGVFTIEVFITAEIRLQIIYNRELNYFGVYNAELHLAFVIDGKTGNFGIFNTSTNGALVFNLNTGLGLYIQNAGDLSGQFSVSLQVGFNFIYEVVVKNCSIDRNSPNAFKLEAFLVAIFKNQLSSWTIYGELNASFGAYLAALAKVENGESYGIVVLVVPIFVEINDTSLAFIAFIGALIVDLEGQFNAELFILVEAVLQLETGELVIGLNRITSAIRAVGSIFVDLNAAIEAYNKGIYLSNVTVSVVAGVTVTTVIVGEGNWLITLVAKNLDVVIYYEKASNVLGVVNRNVNIAAVFLGNGSGLFGLLNVKSGGVLVVNGKNGRARLVVDTSLIAAFAVTSVLDLGVAIVKFAGVVEVLGKDLGGLLPPRDSFNFAGVVAALALRVGWEAAYNLIFIGNAALQRSVEVHFHAFFLVVRTDAQSGGVFAFSGAIGAVRVLFGSVQLFSAGFFGVIGTIYGKLQGTFNAQLALQIYTDFTVSIYGYLTGSVKVLFSIFTEAFRLIPGFIVGIFGSIDWIVNFILSAHAKITVSWEIGGGAGGGFVIGGGGGGGGAVTVKV